MEKRRLGRSDLEASVLGLGCNNFGMKIDLCQLHYPDPETPLAEVDALQASIEPFSLSES